MITCLLNKRKPSQNNHVGITNLIPPTMRIISNPEKIIPLFIVYGKRTNGYSHDLDPHSLDNMSSGMVFIIPISLFRKSLVSTSIALESVNI